MDEADQILLDFTCTLPTKVVVGLSATAFSADMIFEKEYLERHQFICIDSKLSGFIDAKTATDVASIEGFMTKSVGYAKLVYANECNTFPPKLVTKTNCNDLARLKVL